MKKKKQLLTGVSMKRTKAKQKAVTAIRTIVQAAKELAQAEAELLR